MGALLGFAFGPVGRWLLIGAAVLAWTVAQRHDAATKARAECRADQLQATLDETIRQREIAEAALKLAQDRSEQAQIELDQLEAENDQIKADLGAERGRECRVPRNATKRLRNIK